MLKLLKCKTFIKIYTFVSIARKMYNIKTFLNIDD